MSKQPRDLSRRRFLRASAAAAASTGALGLGRTGVASDAPPVRQGISWSTYRACPNDVVVLSARLPAVADGSEVRFSVKGPDGVVDHHIVPAEGGRAAVGVRLGLPRSHAKPGTHKFTATAKVAGARSLGPVVVEVIAARFSFGL